MIELLSLIIVAVLGAIALVRPAWAFVFILCMFGLEQLLQACHPIFIDRSSLTNISIGVLAIWAVLVLAFSGQLTTRRFLNVAFSLTLFLYALASLSQLWSPSPLLPYLVTESIPYNLLSFILAPLLISRVRDLREMFTAFLIVGTIVCFLLAINPKFVFWGGRYILYLDTVTKSNPLATGTLGGMVMIVAVLMVLPNPSKAFTALRIAAFIMGTSLAMLSGSRGQVMFTIPLLIAMYPLAKRVRNFAGFAQTVAGILLVAVAFFVVSSFFVVRENENRWNSESLLYGGEGRFQNVVDLFTAYLRRPEMWLTGLGSDAFNYIPNQTGDIYSHVLLADLLCELGVLGASISAILFIATANAGVRLFRLVADDPVSRALVGTLIAVTLYQFLLSQKMGQIWGAYPLFMFCIILVRMERISREDLVLAASRATADEDEEWAEEDSPRAEDGDGDFEQNLESTPDDVKTFPIGVR